MRRDLVVQWRVFAGIAAFVAFIAVVYWFASYEQAGTVMLALASALSGFVATFLFLQERRLGPGVPEADEQHEVATYLPTSSIWPLLVAVGAALAINGLILGWPYAVPGGAALVVAVIGFVGQGRRRA
jgi:divalent metal cation (Fe/Co/Zn/Cd) transporter